MVERTANVSGAAREATISGLSPSTQYTVKVAAENGAGIGAYSTGIFIMTSGRFICWECNNGIKNGNS